MNLSFFNKTQPILAADRLDAYRQDGADPLIALARYLWNMAVSEALYSPLQMVEIALRNALQRALEEHFDSKSWYDVPSCWQLLTPTQQSKILEAKQNLNRQGNPLTPGRVVAELTFGFWTAFFNKHFAQSRDVTLLASNAFQGAPKSERNLRSLNQRLTLMRELRNRVFHHGRIIHWKDLDARHLALLETIGWISSELLEMAVVLDRFPVTRKAGIQPWVEKLRFHWPDSTVLSSAFDPVVAKVEKPVDATCGAETPFGHRWGGQVINLSPSLVADLFNGGMLALDVMEEYVVFLKSDGNLKGAN